MDTRTIIRCLPLLASTLGRKYGVTVEIGGPSAYTDGKTIRLPSLPTEADQTFLGLMRGYLDHEAAHVRFTDFELVQSTNVTPLERHIWNILEDWRIERQMAQVFPGCADNFKWLIANVFGTPTGPSAYPLLDWLLLTVRSWAVPDLKSQVSTLANHLDQHYPNLRSELEAVLEQMLQHCPNTATTLTYAREIVEVIKSHARVTDQQPQNQASLQKESPVCAGIKTSKSQEETIADQNQIQPNQQELSLTTYLNMGEDDLPQAMDDRLRQELETDSQQSTVMEVAVVQDKPAQELEPDVISTCLHYTSGLRHRLHGLLQSTQRRESQPAQVGKIATKLLHRIAVQNPQVFVREQDRPAINTAVHILLDASSSMRKRIELAAGACYAVAHALQQSGINVGITAFPGSFANDRGLPTVTPLLRHGDRLTTRLQPKAKGCTPLAEALWWLLPQLQILQERRKLLLVITDGKPDDMDLAKRAIATARAMGIEVIGLGILSPKIHDLLPGGAKDISELCDLAPAMIGMLQSNLINQPS